MMRNLSMLTLVLALAAATSTVNAEGKADLNVHQGLFADTDLFVDIDDADNEEICWTGTGSVTVVDPDSTTIGTITSGNCVDATTSLPGVYEVVLNADQLDYTTSSSGAITVLDTYEWDIAVREQNTGTVTNGHLWSDSWQFGTPGFAEEYATNGSFYARVPGGTSDEDAVVELRLRGLSGYVYTILANRTGVAGDNAGRGVPQAGAVVYREYALYLNPPDLASYITIDPVVTDVAFDGGMECLSIEPGVTVGTFSFGSNVEGTFHIVCDLNDNGEFYDPEDLLLVEEADVGVNTLEWNGMTNRRRV